MTRSSRQIIRCKAQDIELPNPRAFTLIELLVVTAIIAILAALLVPALSTSKGQSQSASCKNHLRQMGIAMQSYVNDFKAYPIWTTPPNSWQDLLRPYYPLVWTNVAYHCPSYHGVISEPNNFYSARIGSYGYNVCGDWPNNLPLGLGGDFPAGSQIGFIPPPIHESQVVAPSEMFELMDSRGQWMSNSGAALWVGGDTAVGLTISTAPSTIQSPPQHGSNFNVVFCDAHVAAVKIADLLNPTNTAKNWNNDHQSHPEFWNSAR